MYKRGLIGAVIFFGVLWLSVAIGTSSESGAVHVASVITALAGMVAGGILVGLAVAEYIRTLGDERRI